MSYIAPPSPDPQSAAHDPAQAIARLGAVHDLVVELSGGAPQPALADIRWKDDPEALYARAPTLIQKRFDTLAVQTASFSAAGVAALIAVRGERTEAHRAAADHLAAEMRRSIRAMAAMLAW